LRAVSPIRANATNTLAPLVWFARQRRRLSGARRQRRVLLTLLITSLVGGLTGALILLETPEATFSACSPGSFSSPTLIFILANTSPPRCAAWSTSTSISPSIPEPFIVGCVSIVIAIYGGFFGGGIGILMLALLTLLGYENIHA